MVRAEVETFIRKLLEFFERRPEAKTSLSPNNIFIVISGETCRCLLVDAGPAPFHDYSRFVFSGLLGFRHPSEDRTVPGGGIYLMSIHEIKT